MGRSCSEGPASPDRGGDVSKLKVVSTVWKNRLNGVSPGMFFPGTIVISDSVSTLSCGALHLR